MGESSMAGGSRHFTPRAVLAGIGAKLQALDLFGPSREGVRVEQKVVKDTPAAKLYDAFIAILAGAHGLVQVNSLQQLIQINQNTNAASATTNSGS